MEFVASLFRSLSWPAALVIVAVLFRRQIRGLVGRLETARLKDAELSFTREVEQVSERVVEGVALTILPRQTVDPEVIDDEADDDDEADEPRVVDLMASLEASLAASRRRRVQGIASTLVDYPSAAVLAAWQEVESELRHRGGRMGIEKAESYPIPFLTEELRDSDVISATDTRTVQELRRLRNEVAHEGVHPSPAAALEYAETVDRFLANLGHQPVPPPSPPMD